MMDGGLVSALIIAAVVLYSSDRIIRHLSPRTTNMDNNLGRDRKGRAAVRAESGKSKLKTEQVIEIKRRLAKGQTAYRIALDFGVSDGCVAQIRRGKAWAHIDA